MSISVLTLFESITDPRRESGHYLYSLNELIFLTISGVLCGAEDWVNISEFGSSQLEWLRKHLPYSNGIPSHDTLGRVFEQLDSEEFERCFVKWTEQIEDLTQGELIAIDGKTVCKSHDTTQGKKAIHLVSAFASRNNICIGQVKTSDKSNEITAIPQLLDLICIQGSVVTIDAMGCQKKIASHIVEEQADYVLALKANQEELLEEVKQAFKFCVPQEIDKHIDAAHGRVESRVCELISDLRFVDEARYWKGLKSVVRITAKRSDKTHHTEQNECRYYITTLTNAKRVNKAVRSHWGIENALHWVLDVRFNEDFERKRKGSSPYNLSFITKSVLNMIRLDQAKGSIKTKRLKAAWDISTRERILKLK
ncbi:MAG: ISAs1 family transposase [Bacteroidota bacterium]